MISPGVDLNVAYFTEWYLFTIYSSHHLSEGVKFNVDCLDMFYMVHFDLYFRSTIGARLFKRTDRRYISGLNGKWVIEETLP